MKFNLDKLLNNNEIKSSTLDEYIYMNFDINNMIENPLIATYSIENHCNLNCKHCWDKDNNEGKKNTIPPNLKMIDLALKKLKLLNILHLVLTGGEPFLRKDIFEIIKSIKNERFSLTILTNGTLLNKEKINILNEILNKRTDTIQVSLDGLEKSHNNQREKNIFFHIIENIKYMVQLGIKVRVHSVVTFINIEDIKSLYKFLNDVKVSIFSISPVYSKNRGAILEKSINYEKYLKIIYDINEFRKISPSSIPFEYSLSTKCFEFMEKKNYRVNSNTQTVIFLKNYLSNIRINTEGNVYPGNFSSDDFCIGNIYNDRLNNIYELEQYKHILAGRDLNKTKCKSCGFVHICQGGDLIKTYETYKDFNYSDPNCCL